jgi:hypothetical protein
MKTTYISVDIEASGPIPGDYNLLSVGLSVVGEEDDPEKCFYIELKPMNDNFIPEAMEHVGGLTLEGLRETGVDPKEAMEQIEAWLAKVTPAGYRPVHVAWPSSFDFMWTHWYFIHFLGRDPFGHSGVDIRSYAMGALELDYEAANKRTLSRRGIRSKYKHTHNALDDAKGQGSIFYKILLGFGWGR